jgi:hypothetical protein
MTTFSWAIVVAFCTAYLLWQRAMTLLNRNLRAEEKETAITLSLALAVSTVFVWALIIKGCMLWTG